MATKTKAKAIGVLDGSHARLTIAAQDLLLWLRKNRFSVTHVRVGDVELSGLIDGGAERERIREGLKGTEEARQGIYQEMAGVLAKPPEQEPAGEDMSEPTEEDDDE